VAYKIRTDRYYEEYINKNYISKASLNLACPDDSEFAMWSDIYPGQLSKATAIGCLNREGLINGWHIAWQRRNVKEHEGLQLKGLAQGEWSYFHKNGKILSRGSYNNSNKEGVWSYWDENGKYLGGNEYSNGEPTKYIAP
jgi:antitoxin component YwqK of YwqJK toxin-antitoxin module